MGKLFDAVLKTLAVLCVIAFIIATGTALLLFNAERKLFDSRSYLDALETENIYDRIPSLVADVAASGNNGDNLPPYLQLLPATDWEKIVEAVIPPDIMRAITQQTVVSIFDFLDGKSDQAVVPLTEFKTFLGGPQGLEAAQSLLTSLPDCTPDQLLEMAISNFFGDEGSFYLCRPPEDLGGSMLDDFLASGLQDTAGAIPDQIIVFDTQNPDHAKLVPRLRVVRLAMLFSIFLPLVFLALIAIFAVRSLRDWLGWWGASLFLGGVFGLIVAAAVNPIFRVAFRTILLPRLPFDAPASVSEIVRDLIASVLSGVAAPIVFQSILILLAGIVLLLATRYRRSVSKVTPPPANLPPAPKNASAVPPKLEGKPEEPSAPVPLKTDEPAS
jgi:hypothetical protein